MTKQGVVQAVQAPSTTCCLYIEKDDVSFPFPLFLVSFSVSLTNVSTIGVRSCGRMKNQLDF